MSPPVGSRSTPRVREWLFVRGVLWAATLVSVLAVLWAFFGYGVVEFGEAANDVAMLRENADWQVSTRPSWVEPVRIATLGSFVLTATSLAAFNWRVRRDEPRNPTAT